MEVKDIIISYMLQEKKPKKLVTGNGIKVSRPNQHSILAQEIYASGKTAYTEAQVITGLIELLEINKIKTYETKKTIDGIQQLVTWWELV